MARNGVDFTVMFRRLCDAATGPDSDAAVRKAMAMAIDHTALIQTARRGFASPLCTDHPAGIIPGYQANAACPTFDPAAANKLLDQDGWTTKDANGVWSVPEAVAHLRALSAADIELCEEPVAGLDAIATVAEESEVPVALDESAVLPG